MCLIVCCRFGDFDLSDCKVEVSVLGSNVIECVCMVGWVVLISPVVRWRVRSLEEVKCVSVPAV